MSRLNFFGNSSKVIPIDVDSYLRRLRIQKEPPSLAYLKKLHKAHLLHIPFENLDIHYRNKIVLDYKDVFHKLITMQRGGFCYELNGLFYHLLYHLGYEAHLISAQTRKGDGYSKDYDHMAIIVSMENENWLVDVGFGESFQFPKKVELNTVQMDYTDYWKLVIDADDLYVLQQSRDYSVFYSKYRFNLEEKQPIQFIEMCEYHQTSPDSHFTGQKMITKLTENGRVTLTERKLKVIALGEATETEIMNEDEFLSKLRHHFSIGFKQLLKRKKDQ